MALLPTSLPSSRCPPVKAQQCSYPLSYTSSIHPSMLPPLFNIALMFYWDFFAFTFCFLSTILPSSALIFSLPHLLLCSTSPLLPLFFGIPPQAPDFYPELKQPLPHLFLQHGTYLIQSKLFFPFTPPLLPPCSNPILTLSFPFHHMPLWLIQLPLCSRSLFPIPLTPLLPSPSLLPSLPPSFLTLFFFPPSPNTCC